MDPQTSPHRKMIALSVSSVLREIGFDSSERETLGTLTEMMQACMLFINNFYVQFIHIKYFFSYM